MARSTVTLIIQRKAVTQDKSLADPEKFQQFVHEQTGQSYEDYKADMKSNLLAQRVVREEVSGKIKFKREELQAYYDEHKDQYQREERIFLREILVAANPDNTSIAEKKAKDLVVQARKGEKFPELAQANSDAASAQVGGFIDPYTKAQLSPELIAAVWEQPKGYISDPIKLPGGFLILKVDDHQKAGLASLDEVESEVTDQLFQPKMGLLMREYLTKLRAQAFLEIKAGYEDTGAAPGKTRSGTIRFSSRLRQRPRAKCWPEGTRRRFWESFPFLAPPPRSPELRRRIRMKSPYVNEVEANQTITGVFLVSSKEVRQKKSGEPYLSLILTDRTGDLEAKMFDNASEAMDTLRGIISSG